MGLLSEIHQISKSGSRDQLNILLAADSDRVYVPNFRNKRKNLAKIRHNTELSLAAISPIVRSY